MLGTDANLKDFKFGYPPEREIAVHGEHLVHVSGGSLYDFVSTVFNRTVRRVAPLQAGHFPPNGDDCPTVVMTDGVSMESVHAPAVGT